MKLSLIFISLFFCPVLFSQTGTINITTASPLASYSEIWNDVKYSTCNTAANANYMTGAEKEVIYILNLLRTYPALFAKTVLSKYPEVSGQGYLATDSFYYISLITALQKQQPLNILYPDNNCFISAKCHAYNSGITNYVGHERKAKDCREKKYYYGECCDYGHKEPLDIVLSLLIDEGIPSLGHRMVCLTNFTKIGVSIQPHVRYGVNAVLDFYY